MNNNDGRKHVAKSGAKMGQWVACPAEKSCRNGGQHVTDKVLSTVVLWKSESAGRRVPMKDISLQDVQNFDALPVDVRSGLSERDDIRGREAVERARVRDVKRAERLRGEEVARATLRSWANGSEYVINSDGDSVKRRYSKNEVTQLNALFTDALAVMQSDKDGFFLAASKFKQTFAANSLASRHFDTSWRDAVVKSGAAMQNLAPEQRIESLRVFSGFMLDVRNHVPLNTSLNKSKVRLDKRVEADRAAVEDAVNDVKWSAAAAEEKKTAGGKFKAFLASWSYSEDTSRK